MLHILYGAMLVFMFLGLLFTQPITLLLMIAGFAFIYWSAYMLTGGMAERKRRGRSPPIDH